jgi:hypothetical protein
MNYKFGKEETPEGHFRDVNGQLRKKNPKMAERRLMDYKRYTEQPTQLTEDERKQRDLFIDNLKDFCENSLVWLVDGGLKIEVGELNPPHKEFIITLENLKTNGGFKNLKWSETKDHFIPFLTILKRRYSIRRGEIEIIKKLSSSKETNYNLDISDLINDKSHIWNDELCGMKIRIN